LAELASGLDDCLPLLDRHGGPCAGRYATVSASLAASWEACSEAERSLLRRLARPSVGLGLPDPGADDADLEALEHLVARSLLHSDPGAPPGGRLRLLGLVRQFVRRQP
jgi:hypothetical protein